MDEAFAYYYACRSNVDNIYGDPDPGFFDNIDDPSQYGSPWHWSQYDESRGQHYNSWILSSTMWDLIKHTMPAGGDSWPANDWDDIMWLVIANSQRPHTFSKYRDRAEYWASFWGSGWVDHVRNIFSQHGISNSPTAPPRIADLPKTLPVNKNPIPSSFSVMQNYPNPFNPETWIPFQLSQEADVNIRICDALGQLVHTLTLGRKEAGYYIESPKPLIGMAETNLANELPAASTSTASKLGSIGR